MKIEDQDSEKPINLPNTARKRAFCEQYAVIRNGTKAAIAAGYSAKTAAAQAWNLLQEPECKAFIAYLEKEKLAEADIKTTDILLELKKIAFSNIGDYLQFDEEKYLEIPNPDFDPEEEEGILNQPTRSIHVGGLTIKDFSQIPKDMLAAVSEVSETAGAFGKSRKFKLHSKLDAISQLRALLGTDQPKKTENKHQIEGGTLPVTTFSLKKRADPPPNE